jgi:hypothetical protein
MERVPTQTDLIRLCDAVDAVVGYYERHFLEGIGTDNLLREMQRLSKRMLHFHDVVKNIPFPAEFFIPRKMIDMQDAFTAWHGWEGRQFEAFVVVLDCAREVHHQFPGLIDGMHHRIHVCHFKKFGGSQESRDNMAVWKLAAERLRSACRFDMCEVQKDIFSALDGKRRTKTQLASLCGVSQSKLVGKRNDPQIGGLNEMMNLGLIANDGRGYYRPDRPPE